MLASLDGVTTIAQEATQVAAKERFIFYFCSILVPVNLFKVSSPTGTMKFGFIFIIGFLALLPFGSALTQVTIYIDGVGDALFLGESDDRIVLPEGVVLSTEGRINGYTSTLTEKEAEQWRFSYTLPNSEMVVVLPEGAVIKSISKGEITVERGQIAVYAVNETSIRYTIEKPTSSNGLGTFITIIGALVAIVVIGYLANYKNREKSVRSVTSKRKRTDKLDVISSVLSERENLILDKLKASGKTKMSYLRKACDMPKASFSRHIHELVKKKLIALSGEGKNKFVALRR